MGVATYFSFHGVGVELRANANTARFEPILLEAERFWSFYYVARSVAPAIRVSLQSPHNWRVLKPFQSRPATIHFGTLRWYYYRSRFILYDDAFVILGSPKRIDAYLHPDRSFDEREFLRFAMQFALLEALRHHQLFYLHAAALRAPNGTTLIAAGDSGGGKTTLTLGLLASGYRYLSDDALFLDARTPQCLRILSYAKRFHLTADVAARVGIAGTEHKVECDPDTLFPGRRLRSAHHANVILLCQITNAPFSQVRPLRQAATVARLLSASTQVFFDQRLAFGHLQAICKLVRGARGYAFEAGRDVYENPTLYHPLLCTL